jgi:hypothetical protein
VPDNLSETPSDYTGDCVTAPTDARLPSNISGAQACSLRGHQREPVRTTQILDARLMTLGMQLDFQENR